MLSQVWLSPRLAIPLPLWTPLAVSNRHHSEKRVSFTYSKLAIFQPVPIASHPSVVHFWEHSGLVCSTFSHYIAVDSSKILLLSFHYLKMNKSKFLSISSYAMCFSLSPQPPFSLFSSMSMSLLRWGAQKWTHHSRYVLPELREEKDHFPWPAGNVLPHADQDAEKQTNSVLLPQGQLTFTDP